MSSHFFTYLTALNGTVLKNNLNQIKENNLHIHVHVTLTQCVSQSHREHALLHRLKELTLQNTWLHCLLTQSIICHSQLKQGNCVQKMWLLHACAIKKCNAMQEHTEQKVISRTSLMRGLNFSMFFLI